MSKPTKDPRSCGCMRAGIAIMDTNERPNVIERCDACNLFETDDDAAKAVDQLLQVLGAVYESNEAFTVADAFDAIKKACATW